MSDLTDLTDLLSPLAPKWVIWSNEHHGWWRQNLHGYVQDLVDAGRWLKEDAEKIVNQESAKGLLVYHHAELEMFFYDDIMIREDIASRYVED